MDEQEIEQIIQTAMRELKEFGSVTGETNDKLKEAAVSFEQASKEAKAFATQGLKQFAGEIAQGSAGFETLNTAVDTVTNSVSALAQAVPFFGKAIGSIAEGAAEGFKILNMRTRESLDAFQSVSKFGAIGAGGLQQFAQLAINSGLSLTQFQSVVEANAVALSQFKGLTATGAEDFSTIVGQLTQRDTGEGLRELGFSAEQISSAAASFLTLTARQGIAQRMSNMQLAKASADYAKELDTLAKLTGLDVDQLQERQNAILSEARFRARVEQLNAIGQQEAAKRLGDFTIGLERFSPEVARGVRDIIGAGGLVATESARSITLQTQGEIQRIVRGLEVGDLDMAEANVALQNALKANIGQIRNSTALIGDQNLFTQNFVGIQDLVNAQLGAQGELLKAAVDAQNDQINATDKLTAGAVTAEKAFQELNREIDNLTFTFLPTFAKGIGAVATGLVKIVQKGTEAFGIEGADVGLNFDTEIIQKQKDDQARAVLEERGLPVTPENITIINTLGAGSGSRLINMAPGSMGPNQNRRGNLRQILGENPSGMTKEQIIQMIIDKSNTTAPGFQTGGVVAGPKTGYTAMLHGTEAVVPLEGGTDIPVEMQGMNEGMGQQLTVMKDQLNKLKELVSIMGGSKDIQRRILSASYS